MVVVKKITIVFVWFNDFFISALGRHDVPSHRRFISILLHKGYFLSKKDRKEMITERFFPNMK
jgi:hypothetical protein